MKVSPPDFSKEDWFGTPVEYAPGAWVCGEMHAAGGISNLKVNNRAFIYRLTLREDLGGVKKGNECLFIFGLGKPGVIKGVRQLEQQTGLKAVAMMCNGSGHHLGLEPWYEAFPAPFRIWVSPTKPPHTENGQHLMKEYPDRWELIDNSTVPHHAYQLLHYFGQGHDMQVDCIMFNQIFSYSDATSKANGFRTMCCQPDKICGSGQVLKFLKQISDVSQPIDETVFFHKASKMIVTGHHWQFAYIPYSFQEPEAFRDPSGAIGFKLIKSVLLKPGQYNTALGTAFKRLNDPEIHSQQWKEVLKWDFDYATSHHDPVGVCGPLSDDAVMKTKGGVKGYMTRKLDESGELHNTPVGGGGCFGGSNALYGVVKAEPGYRKQFGQPPVLPMGGPNYDARGVLKATECQIASA